MTNSPSARLAEGVEIHQRKVSTVSDVFTSLEVEDNEIIIKVLRKTKVFGLQERSLRLLIITSSPSGKRKIDLGSYSIMQPRLASGKSPV